MLTDSKKSVRIANAEISAVAELFLFQLTNGSLCDKLKAYQDKNTNRVYLVSQNTGLRMAIKKPYYTK